MIIRNGKVFMEDFQFHPGTVLVQGERIAAVSGSGKPEGEKKTPERCRSRVWKTG